MRNQSPLSASGKRSGFTLMELLISVSIIGILMAIGIVSYATINKQSRDTKRKSDIEQIRASLEMYRSDNGYYPSAGGGSFINTTDGLTAELVPSYISIVPTDPRSPSQNYLYKATNASGGSYFGYCLNAALESENPADSCELDTGMNFGAKNP